MRFSIKNKSKGFTLIELLVVIVIIALLATLATVSFINARKRARDAKRLADMRQIVSALALYYDQNGRFPDSDRQGCAGWDTPGDGDFVTPLKTAGFLGQDLKDPSINHDCGNYRYFRYDPGDFSCDASRGAFYVLGVADMEASGMPHPSSPGWKCPTTDWQNFMEWVTGGFEK